MEFRQALFWDVDPKTIDPELHARYIIERVLDFGNDTEVKWVYEKYPQSLIAEVVQQSRSLRPQTKALWQALITI
jgi:hypothetical protein